MYLFVSMVQESPAGKVEEIARTFGVDWPHLAAQTVSFSIVCAVLYLLAYRPVLHMLEERRRQIAQGLINQKKIDEALAGIEAERQRAAADSQAQAAQVIAEAREIAKRVQQQETRRATASAEQIVRKAHETAALERARMLIDAQHEVGRLVVQTAETVIGKVLTSEDQRRLAEETARQLRPM